MARKLIEKPPLTDDDLMPVGKYKGTKMEDVPASYLLYVYDNELIDNKQVINYIEKNMVIILAQIEND